MQLEQSPYVNILRAWVSARAAAQPGDTAKSRQAYQDVLALCKDADPDVPLLQEVKKEYPRAFSDWDTFRAGLLSQHRCPARPQQHRRQVR